MVQKNENENLEKKVSTSRSQGLLQKLGKGLIVAGITGAIGYGVGRVHEAKDGKAHAYAIRGEIKDAAIDGYAWKENADPTFYAFKSVLVKDSLTRTMQGYFGKIDAVGDTVVAGPIRLGGQVGLTVPEKAEQQGKDAVERVKEFGERAIDFGKDKFDAAKEYFGKKDSRLDSVRSSIDSTNMRYDL